MFICRVCGGDDYAARGSLYCCTRCSVVFEDAEYFSAPPIPIALRRKNSKMPTKATGGSIGYDLYASNPVTVKPWTSTIVHTGIHMEIPEYHEAQIRPRSGLGLKLILIPNSPGTIDSDYRDEVGVIVFNARDELFKIGVGDRIAQMVIAPKIPYVLHQVAKLNRKIDRGGGYGSTGR